MTTPQIKFNPVVATYIAIGVAVVYIAWKAFDEWDQFTSRLANSANKYATDAGTAVSEGVYGADNLYLKAQRDYAKASGMVDGGPMWPSHDAWLYAYAGPVGFKYGDANYPQVPEASISQTILTIFSGGI
jgi:hypothetical protein